MRFLHPQIGSWLLAAFAVVVLVRWRGRRVFAAASSLRALPRSTRASVLRRLPFVTLVAALVLTGCALMDPVLPYSESQVQSRGLDIVMVLDLSSSMQEEMERTRVLQNLTFTARDAALPRKPPG